MMKTIRIGSGAGYSGDRIEPAVELAEKGDLDYLVFECLAERTIALAQQAKMKDPRRRLRSAARRAHAGGAADLRARTACKIVTNMGAANPLAAAEATRRDRARSSGSAASRSRPSPATTCSAYLRDHDVRARQRRDDRRARR